MPEDFESPIYRLADGRVEVDPAEHTVTVDGVLAEELRNRNIPFNIISHLASQPDRTIPHEDLCMAVWGYYDESAEKNLMHYMSGLRKVFGSELGDRKKGAVRTKHGLGYFAVSSLTVANRESNGEEAQVHMIADERINVDPEGLTVRVDNGFLHDITKTEFNLLLALAQRPGRVISLWQLLHECNIRSATDIDTPRRYISRLREKLGPELGDPKNGAIRLRRGIGYYVVRSLNGVPK